MVCLFVREQQSTSCFVYCGGSRWSLGAGVVCVVASLCNKPTCLFSVSFRPIIYIYICIYNLCINLLYRNITLIEYTDYIYIYTPYIHIHRL